MVHIFWALFIVCMFADVMQAQSICNVITSPGTYVFYSIVADPNDTGDSLFCIQSDDVIIDFQGNSIMQGNAVDDFTAFSIGSGFSNITIQNVVINGLTGNGVVVGEGCENIALNNISIEACNAGGILFSGSSANPIADGIIDNCLILSCTGDDGNNTYGIRLIFSNDILVSNCTLAGNDAGTVASGFGISLESCDSCRVSACQLDSNGGDVLGIGINALQTTRTIIENCYISNTIARDASAGQAIGIFLNQCNNVLVNNTLAKYSNNALNSGFGFLAGGGSFNIFQQCIAQNNTGSIAASGFVLNNVEAGSSITNCISSNNNAGSSGNGFGIYLDTAQNCAVSFNQLNGNTGLNAYGLQDTASDTTNLIVGNTAFNNTTGGFNVTRTSGTFPMLSAQVGDFSAITNASQYMNIAFSVGP